MIFISLTEKEQCLKFVQDGGAVICRDYTEQQHRIAVEAMARALAVCPVSVLDSLKLIYLYRQGELRNDAIEWYHRRTNGKGMMHSIGIALEAVDFSGEYVSFLFLHETAHILTNQGHTPYFYDVESFLLENFNSRWGTDLNPYR